MRLTAGLTLLFLTVLLSACGIPQIALKHGSMREWSDAPINGLPAHDYLRNRWGLVIAGRGEVSIVNNGRSIDCRGIERRDDGESGTGAGVHIGDGYWLTAAHCVPVDQVRIIRLCPLTPVVLPARVVWRGADDEKDIAILHTPVIDLSIPRIDLCDAAPSSGVVLCFGSGIESNAWASGSITGLITGSDPGFVTIAHSAPLGPGDSGGPAMLEDGRLAGINVTATWRTTTAHGHSWSIWMSPDRIREIMRDDQSQHAIPSGVQAP